MRRAVVRRLTYLWYDVCASAATGDNIKCKSHSWADLVRGGHRAAERRQFSQCPSHAGNHYHRPVIPNSRPRDEINLEAPSAVCVGRTQASHLITKRHTALLHEFDRHMLFHIPIRGTSFVRVVNQYKQTQLRCYRSAYNILSSPPRQVRRIVFLKRCASDLARARLRKRGAFKVNDSFEVR